jgi:hypothetical protein
MHTERHDGRATTRSKAMTLASSSGNSTARAVYHGIPSVQPISYRDAARVELEVNRQLLLAGVLMLAVVLAGAVAFALSAPSIADLVSLYVPTT